MKKLLGIAVFSLYFGLLGCQNNPNSELSEMVAPRNSVPLSWYKESSTILAYTNDFGPLSSLEVISVKEPTKPQPSLWATQIDGISCLNSTSQGGQMLGLGSTTNTDKGPDIYLITLDEAPVLLEVEITPQGCPAWDPVGNRVAFVRKNNSLFELQIIELARPLAQTIYSTTMPLGQITWAPDGHKIAIEVGNEIHIVTLDTQELVVIQPHSEDQRLQWPTWSPDGQFVAYVEADLYEVGGGNLVISQANGASQQYLTRFDYTNLPPPTLQGESIYKYSYPLWSPNGDYIAGARLAYRDELGLSGDAHNWPSYELVFVAVPNRFTP